MTTHRRSVRRVVLCLLASPLCLLLTAPGASAAARKTRAAASREAAPILISLDATAAPRHAFRTKERIPARPGTLVLAYPKWIPGEHGPTGPVVDVVGMRFSAGGKALLWQRDPSDMYLIRVAVPVGVESLEADLDFVTPAEKSGFTSGSSATSQLTVISWNQVLLYPAGPSADDITFHAEVRLPAGWRYGTSLTPESGPPVDGTTPGAAPPPAGTVTPVRFKPVSLRTLVDSPILAGAHFRTVRLSPEGDARPAYLHMAADSEAALQAPPEVLDGYRRLVAEAIALFGARHYDHYHFLLTLSDHMAHFGLEHHESSDDRVPERTLIDPDRRVLHASLLAHEMVHSWNGKYRRPEGLATRDYRQPVDSGMLWVYEGLTNYLGEILTARSGLFTPEQFRDAVAWAAAELDNRPGRDWRPLVDTATAAQILYGAGDAWQSLRRGVDFYDEGTLLWLEADTIIREKTSGKKSLDDFCKLFHGGADGPPALRTYTADDVYAALNKVAPYDWRTFFTERVQHIRPHPPLGGLTSAGWRLDYTDVKPARLKSREEVDDRTDARFSLGFWVAKDATLQDVLGGTPADAAGLAPGMKIVAVNGRAFTRHILEDALAQARGGAAPIEILAENSGFFKTYPVAYDKGLRYPALVRETGKPDLLSEITAPHAGR